MLTIEPKVEYCQEMIAKKERVTHLDYCQYSLLNCSLDVSCVNPIKKYSPPLVRDSDTLKVNLGVHSPQINS